MRGRRESAKRRKYRRKKKKKPKSLAPVGLVLDPVAVVTDVLLPFLRLPRRENGFPLPVPQPQPPAPLVLVPVGALERPAAVPEPSQGLSDVAAAVGEAQLAVPRPWRRREAGLPRRDVFGGRDEGVLVELEFVLGAGGVGVKGVEPRKESFFCANGGENGRRRRRGRKRGENDSGGGVLQTFASLFPLSLSLSLSLSLFLAHPSSSLLLLLLLSSSSESLTETSLGFQAGRAGSISSSAFISCDFNESREREREAFAK